MKSLIHNARLISPGVDITGGSLLWENGRIVSLHEPGDEPLPVESFDAQGQIVMPGFIDIHSHGADGADVCDGSVESVLQVARKKLEEGVTTWLPTTLTQPKGRLSEIVNACGKAMAERLRVDCPQHAKMPGLHLEGPFINRDKAGAQNPEFVRLPDVGELRTLHEIAPIKVLSLAPEIPGALEMIAAAGEMGIVCSAAHTNATFREIHAAMAVGLRQLTHFGNAMSPLHHREIGVVGAGLLDEGLMIEVICDRVHLCSEMLRLIFNCVAIDRIMLVTDSVAASWRPDGEMLLGGMKTEIADGIARLKPGGALAGSTLRFNDGLKIAAGTSGLPLSELVKTTSWNQARSLGLPDVGKLERGFQADLVMLDTDFSVTATWVGGLRSF